MAVIREVLGVVLLVLGGIYELLRGSKDLAALEGGVYRLVQEASRRLLVAVLAEVDRQLSQERDRKRLRSVHSKPRSVLTPFGLVTFDRRYYWDRRTGKGRFLLDEALGLEGRQRLSPWLERLAVRVAVEMPYHRAAALMEELTLGAVDVRAMAVWSTAQRAGGLASEVAEGRRRALFDYGEVPPGKRKARRLSVEADEVVVRGGRAAGEGRWIGVKLAVAYEGKVKAGKDRQALLNRQVTAGVAKGPVFWEQTVADLGRTWDLGEVQETTLGGDGAAWVKQGAEHLPRSTYRLDAYHLRRALRQGLGHHSEGYRQVCEAISSGQWAEVEAALLRAERRSQGRRREKVRALRQYLEANWEGIRTSEEAERLGAIEGQVFHQVARRMKRHGARWSSAGADHLARLLAARANGELSEFMPRARPMNQELLARLASPPVLVREALAAIGDDPAGWLRASLPALEGPHAAKPWVKWCLREITRIPQIA